MSKRRRHRLHQANFLVLLQAFVHPRPRSTNCRRQGFLRGKAPAIFVSVTRKNSQQSQLVAADFASMKVSECSPRDNGKKALRRLPFPAQVSALALRTFISRFVGRPLLGPSWRSVGLVLGSSNSCSQFRTLDRKKQGVFLPGRCTAGGVGIASRCLRQYSVSPQPRNRQSSF